MKNHYYQTNITWTGNTGEGTKNYASYERAHTISVDGKATVLGSSDPAFRGDKSRYNPEEMLVASVSACHMLWFLHLCSATGIVVIAYDDHAEGIMEETTDGGGHFTQIILKPVITIPDQNLVGKANEMHHEANRLCFIANSCNFPIFHNPEYRFA
ncbi:OsmC family protein [soil metagenome]|jgi:organic hydroperoxide reductase OsmC/OhrA